MKTSMKRDLRRGAGVIAAVSSLVIYMALVALPAGAAVACNFAAGVASVTLDANNDAVTMSVNGNAIQFNAANCSTATTANTNTINVDAVAPADVEDQSLTIDLSGGPFAPGAADEPGTTDEIEFAVNLGAGNDTVTVTGSSGADSIVIGAGGINLNASGGDDDADVTLAGVENVAVNAGGGNDTVNGSGGVGTGAAYASPLDINGGDGDDNLTSSGGEDLLNGGNGADTMSSGGANDTINGDDGDDTASGGPGSDQLNGGTDRDALSGNADDDTLNGNEGADRLTPGEGDDEVIGGLHKDTVSFADATAPVDVDLSDFTASTGPDDDSIVTVENVQGSTFVDTVRGTGQNNKVNSGKGGDAVRGAGGDDDIHGGPGPDTLRGGDGDDDLFGQGGADHLFGGAGTDLCKGGKGADTLTGCE